MRKTTPSGFMPPPYFPRSPLPPPLPQPNPHQHNASYTLLYPLQYTHQAWHAKDSHTLDFRNPISALQAKLDTAVLDCGDADFPQLSAAARNLTDELWVRGNCECGALCCIDADPSPPQLSALVEPLWAVCRKLDVCFHCGRRSGMCAFTVVGEHYALPSLPEHYFLVVLVSP
jgi:hypothetical protein